MYAALLANTLNGGEVVTREDLGEVLPKLRDIFARLGHMEHSSGVLFGMFLEQGVGAYPIIVGYENQLVEFSIEHPESLPLLKSKLRVLYPRPTVWANHPLIAVTEAGARLLDALRDEEVQRIAQLRHGFRTGLGGSELPEIMKAVGLPPAIDAVMSTPSASVMQEITAALTP
jgi:hypothetical protein